MKPFIRKTKNVGFFKSADWPFGYLSSMAFQLPQVVTIENPDTETA